VVRKGKKLRAPYSTKKDYNWEEIETTVKKEEENEKPEGEAALQHLFQKIYGGADEKVRMAMNKSYQTSGGTVLSTDWEDVSKQDYTKNRTAPQGQEFRKWEE